MKKQMGLKIATFPDGILRKFSSRAKLTPTTVKLVLNMVKTMYIERALGLAANQVGRQEQIVVIDVHYTSADPIVRETCQRTGGALVLINPVIKELSGEMITAEEGCLSFPDLVMQVPRYSKVIVEADDMFGYRREITADLASGDILSRVIQHELDHLKGKLMIDYNEASEQVAE